MPLAQFTLYLQGMFLVITNPFRYARARLCFELCPSTSPSMTFEKSQMTTMSFTI